MNEARLRELVTRLRPPSSPEERVSAARNLEKHDSLPAWCAEPLVEALADDAHEVEDWTDWDGTVTGATAYFAREYARAALLRMGAPAIASLVERAADRELLAQIVGRASPGALSALPAEVLAALPALVKGTSTEAEALESLAWRDSGTSDTERLVSRLGHHASSVVADACVALAASPATPEIADAVFRALMRGPVAGTDVERAERVLEGLAPYVSDAVMREFLDAKIITSRFDPSVPVLRAVLAWGPRAKLASDALMKLLLRRLNEPNVVWAATLAAMVVAAVVGPPARLDDPRVNRFLEGKPKHDVLDALVKACGGGSGLAPLVLERLTKALIDGPHLARADAVARLTPLREAAEPAGDALLVALESFIAEKANYSVSPCCWALAQAGAARQRALPRFISLLETEHAGAAMHGLNGMSEEASSALPALEAFLTRNPKNWDREAAVRLIKRIRHLAKIP